MTEPKEIEIRSLGCITQVCRLKSQQQKEVVQVIEVSPVKEEREREREKEEVTPTEEDEEEEASTSVHNR